MCNNISINLFLSHYGKNIIYDIYIGKFGGLFICTQKICASYWYLFGLLNCFFLFHVVVVWTNPLLGLYFIMFYANEQRIIIYLQYISRIILFLLIPNTWPLSGEKVNILAVIPCCCLYVSDLFWLLYFPFYTCI